MRMKPVAFYAEIARELGSINAALFYQQIRYWSDKGSREDGWIYKSAIEIEEETTLTENMQRLCRKILTEDKKWIECKKMKVKGAPTWHYRLIVDFQFEIIRTVKTTVPNVENHSSEPTKTTVPLYREYTENTTSEKETFSRPRGSRKTLEDLKDELPNTELGEIPKTNHRPPMEIKEEMRVARRMSGMYNNSFGSKAIQVVKYFCALYDEKYKMPYGKIVQVDTVAKNISTFFKEGETVETLMEMLNLYMNSEKANKLTVRLTTAFSDDTYRSWKQGKLGNADSAGIYPMKIGHLIARNDEHLGELFTRGLIYSVGEGKWALTPKGKEVSI